MDIRRFLVGIVTSTMAAGALAAAVGAAPKPVIHDMMNQTADKAVVDSGITSTKASTVIHDM